VSTLLSVTDSRRIHPFARHEEPDLGTLTREDLVRTFLDVPIPETSALLAVIAEVAGVDDVLRARIRRELGARPQIESAWLAKLPETETYRAVRMSHVVGDGDNILLGARLPGGYELTCLVYIDHNLGTVVKDAFVVPASIADMVAEFKRVTEDPDTRWDDVSLADARAWVDAAIELAAITFPPLESDTWPACRALVEWITRGLPEGGNGYQRPQWDSAALARLAGRFFAVDRCCEEMLDVEYRTACRRLLARVAFREPEVFRRKGRVETAAAALVWIVGKANDVFEQRTGGMQVRDLMSHFGLGQSSVASRAATMLRAGGFHDDTYIVRLGSPDYLVAAHRRLFDIGPRQDGAVSDSRGGLGACFEDLTILLCLGLNARATRTVVVWWKVMSSSGLSTPRLAVAAAAWLALLAIGVPSATAAPATDGQGFVDSTARCTSPDAAVVFGSTETSRVAICKAPGGQYEYRGVRVRDGAKLIVPATRSGDGGFVAENDGTAYTVTASSLVVSVGNQVIREEPMVNFHETGTTTPTASPPPTPLPPPLPAEVGGSGS
jgi:hypothetical protein